MTEAVTEAVRERLKRVQNQDKRAAKLSDRLLESAGTAPAPEGTVSLGRSWRPSLRREGAAEMILDTSAVIAILRFERKRPSSQKSLSAPRSVVFRRELCGSRSGD